MKASKISGLSVLPLALFITGSIDSVRNFPATALFGESIVFFLIFGALIFLVPTALVSAQLASALPAEGGVYGWIKKAFGTKTATLAVWLQWINTMVWFPTMLSFIAATLAYLFMPSLAENKLYLISMILSLFWGLTLLSFKGFNTSTRIANLFALVGMCLPMLLIIGLEILWLIKGMPLQINLSLNNMIPDLSATQSWTSLTAIMAAFLGIELACVHVNQVNDPSRTFPKALLLSVGFIVLTMLLGALAIAMVIPAKDISLVNGVMQAFNYFFAAFGLSSLVPLVTLMLILGATGGMINWLLSPAKGLLMIANDGFLPAKLTQLNKAGVPQNLLLVQAGVVTLLCFCFYFMPSINSSYWLLTDLSTQLYMVMYLILFCAAIKLSGSLDYATSHFNIAGKQIGLCLAAGVGICGGVLSIIIGFFEPSHVTSMDVSQYALLFLGCMTAMILPVTLLYRYQRKLVKLHADAN